MATMSRCAAFRGDEQPAEEGQGRRTRGAGQRRGPDLASAAGLAPSPGVNATSQRCPACGQRDFHTPALLGHQAQPAPQRE